MRFVAVKSEEQQASGLVFCTRDLLVRQHTQTINAIHGYLAGQRRLLPKWRCGAVRRRHGKLTCQFQLVHTILA